MSERVETLVVGGGMAGLPLALRAARFGRTMLVEQEQLGGTCLNRGCIPTKTMIASAAAAHSARRAASLGVRVTGVDVDLPAVVDRKDRIVSGIRSGSERAAAHRDGLEVVSGQGQFQPGRRFVIAGRAVRADRIILATGTRDSVPAMDGLDRVDFLTSRSILDLRELPRHLLVVGGGFIGCELAQMFRRFGSRVSIVTRADRLLPAEDAAVSAVVEDAFREEGIEVHTSTACVAADAEPGGGVRISCSGVGERELRGSHLLLATGRTPNTDTLGLEHLGLQPTPAGHLDVDDRLRTSAPDVWAIGDLRGQDMFTHTARDDADIVYRTVFRGDSATIAGRIVPHAVFVDPEVAVVGLTEDDARDRGHEVAVGQVEFSGVARARAMDRTRGFVRLVADAGTRRLLGAQIVGPDAGSLIHEAVAVMHSARTVDDIAAAIHIHPTLAEAVNAAAGGVHRPAV